MPEIKQLTFSYKELAEILVKHSGINEGIWGVSAQFGLKATNFGPDESNLTPTAIIPLLSIGLSRLDKETNLSVDAAKVNPGPVDKSHAKRAK